MMLVLRVAAPGEQSERPATPLEGAVNVWRDAHGAALARGWSDERWCWLDWPGVALFRFDGLAAEAVAFPHGAARPALIADVFRRFVLPVALQARGFETLHASAALMPRGACVFCARSATGKSTVAHGLGERGFRQLADDAVVLDFAGPRPALVPLPFTPRLGPAGRRRRSHPLEEKDAAGGVSRTAERGARAMSCVAEANERIAVSALVVLSRLDSAAGAPSMSVVRLPPLRAFREVLAHANPFDPVRREPREAMLRRYLDLTATVPTFALSFRTGLDRLPAILDAIETLPAEVRA